MCVYVCLNPGGWKLAATFATIDTSHTLDLMHMIKPMIDKALANMLTEAEKKLHVHLFFFFFSISGFNAACCFFFFTGKQFRIADEFIHNKCMAEKEYTVSVLCTTHTQVDLNSKIDSFFSSIETKAWWCAGHKKIATVQLLCKWEKATLQKYTHIQSRTLALARNRYRASQSRCLRMWTKNYRNEKKNSTQNNAKCAQCAHANSCDPPQSAKGINLPKANCENANGGRERESGKASA